MNSTVSCDSSTTYHNLDSSDNSDHSSLKDKKAELRKPKRKYRCRVRSPATIERARKQRRDKANARERRRMDSLNEALDRLRTLLPQLPSDPKMTKIETLRMAQGYIHMLSSMLADDAHQLSDHVCSSIAFQS